MTVPATPDEVRQFSSNVVSKLSANAEMLVSLTEGVETALLIIMSLSGLLMFFVVVDSLLMLAALRRMRMFSHRLLFICFLLSLLLPN